MATEKTTINTLHDVQETLLALHALAENFDSQQSNAGDNLAHIVALLTKSAGERIDACLDALGDVRTGWADDEEPEALEAAQ